MSTSVTVDISGNILQTQNYLSNYFVTLMSDQTIYGAKKIDTLNVTSDLTTASFFVNDPNQTQPQSQLSLTAQNSSFNLSISPGATLNMNVSKLLLSGLSAPANAQSLITQGSDGLQWFTLKNLETGIYVNTTLSREANIKLNMSYTIPPTIILTPDSHGSNHIVAVTLNGVTTTNFSVLFTSNKLSQFRYIVLPTNTSYISVAENKPTSTSQNISTANSTLSVSHLDAGKVYYSTGVYGATITFNTMFPSGYNPSITLSTFGGSFAAISVFNYVYDVDNNCTGFNWVSNGDVGALSYIAL